MCDPLTIAGLALGGTSLFSNMQAARQQQKARAAAMQAENQRQRRLDREIFGVVDETRGQYEGEDFSQAQAERESQLAQFFSENASGALPGTAPAIGDAVTNQAVRRESNRASQFNNQQNNALGALRGFGDLFAETSRQTAKNASEAGILSGFKQGSAAVLPLELEAANQAGGVWNLFGDLANLGSGVALFGGLGGGGGKPGIRGSVGGSGAQSGATNPLLRQYLGG